MQTQPTIEPFLIVPCVVVQCSGGCAEPFGAAGPPHFETIQEAVAALRDECWLFIGNLAWCPTCSVKADCEATGHQWQPWTDDTVEGLPCQQRTCQHCAEQEYTPPLSELQVLVQLRELDWNGGDEAH